MKAEFGSNFILVIATFSPHNIIYNILDRGKRIAFESDNFFCIDFIKPIETIHYFLDIAFSYGDFQDTREA